jgi:hypothetical protein
VKAMATIITVNKGDTKETIHKKLQELNDKSINSTKKFPAKKFTGKVTSFGDGLDYQRAVRNEWE